MKKLLFFFVLGFMFSCSKKNSSPTPPPATAPVVTTIAISNITRTTAQSGGTVSSPGASLTVAGVCWATTPGPTNFGSSTTNGSIGTFSSNLTGLTPGTSYYVRAYAVPSYGPIGYGNEISFTTLP